MPFTAVAFRAGSTGAPQVAVLRRRLDTALRVHGFADGDYATRAKDVLDTVRDPVDAGHAAEARPLARHAVELLAEAMGAARRHRGGGRASTVIAAGFRRVAG